MKAKGANYLPTQFYPGVPLGTVHKGFRCEDLARQTFDDETFDLVVTQDVLEHLPEPIEAFREIYRTLKPGGAHIFTVPWFYWANTKVRARIRNGEIEHIEPPDYHGNPVDANGSLVITEWGDDLCDTIYKSCGMTTTILRIKDNRLGIDGKLIEVFISKKPAKEPDALLSRW